LDQHASADPKINDIANNHPPQPSADNSLHTPAQHDDNGSPAVTDGAHPAPQVDGIESASPKFADDGSANSGKVPHDPAALTALPTNVSGDDSAQPFQTNLDRHASADPDINDVTNHPPQPSADNSLQPPAQHADNGSPAVTDGAHTAPQVDGIESASPKFADDGSTHPGAGPDGAHTAHTQVDGKQSDSFKFADDSSGPPDTGPDAAHTAHPQVDVDQLPSFNFAGGGTVPSDAPALTAQSSDSSGAHGPAAPALAKPSDIPGPVMSAAPDQFVFADKAGPVADHKPDITDIDHPVPADIQQVLDTAHETNAVSPPDPGHANALPETANAQAQYHADAFHFA